MSTIQAELYDALMAVKVPKEKAHAAAAAAATITTNYPKPEELATKEYIEKRIAELEARIAELKGELKAEMAELKGELKAEMAELKVEITKLEGVIDTKMAELKVEMAEQEVRLMRHNRVSTGIMIGALTIATTVIIAVVN